MKTILFEHPETGEVCRVHGSVSVEKQTMLRAQGFKKVTQFDTNYEEVFTKTFKPKEEERPTKRLAKALISEAKADLAVTEATEELRKYNFENRRSLANAVKGGAHD